MRGPKGIEKKVTRTTVTTVATRAEFKPEDLRRLLRLPADAALSVRVPGGGDWSNTDLDIEDDRPLIAEWTERKES